MLLYNKIVNKMKLIIVESPGKIKKISSILSDDYLVKASVGHIRDLDKKGLSYDETTFDATYEIMADKKEVVSNLKSAAKNASVIYLASDPDREGEAISQGLKEVLKLKDYHRITFNSITSTAIKQAIDSPRKIDDALVEAQETRRILDRMLGYKISPVLMKKYGMGALSAGRVQSVVVRIMVDLENSIKSFQPEAEFNGHGDVKINGKKIGLNLYYKNKLFRGSEEDAKKILKRLVNSKFELVELNEKTREQNPPPPFITSTLQQEASNKLRYDLQKTMKIAQGLYEAGKITYMRTDSPSISKEAIEPIKQVITDKYTIENYKFRTFQSKSASAQEGHECVRPTHPEEDSDDSIGSSLYNLIWKRTIASMMTPAIHQVFDVTINCSSDPNITFKGSIERLHKPGFLLVYGEKAEEEITLDSSKKSVNVTGIHMNEKISSPPGRYGEASLVKDLEKLEIGRPSTYAALITKIKDRKYIEERDHEGLTYDQKVIKLSSSGSLEEEAKQVTLGKEKKRLTPTELGLNITKILIEMFPQFMDIHFTAQTEKVLDEIAGGKKKKIPVLTEYWKILQKNLETIGSMIISKPDSIELGEYKDGKLIIVTTRYGLAVKYEPNNKTKDNKNVKYVSITDKDIDLPQAILLLENKSKGSSQSGTEIGNEGKYKYVKDKSKFGDVIKRISGETVEYRNIDKYTKEIDMNLAKLLFSYPKDINKKISLNYNLIKDSYYLKEDKTYVSVPKDKIDSTKEDLLGLWEANKDKVKKKFVKKT
jgi:DNA topoisomerase-1